MEQFDITPDFAHMLNVMLRSAKDMAVPTALLYDLHALTPESKAEVLRSVQAFLAPLNVAAQCVTTSEALEQFREVLAEMATALDAYRINLEHPTDPTDGEGLL